MDCRALTVSQPYASLIASGEKWVENRTWSTNYRGLLLIHAGSGTQYMSRRSMENQQLPRGAIVASARLVSCATLDELKQLNPTLQFTESERTILDVLRHTHTEGPHCWVLSQITPLEPIYCTGRQGLWTPPAQVIRQVCEQLL